MRKRLPALSGALLISLLLAACSASIPPLPQLPAADQLAADQPSADQSADLTPLLLTTTLSPVPLSTRPWLQATNGYGPAERNMSNGEAAAGDGRAISLRGRIYASGIGVHAASSVSVALTGCTGFRSDVGVDDEANGLGQVTFEVWADGVRVYQSARLTGKSLALPVRVPLAGRKVMQLVVTDGGNGVDYDHADWAGATLTGCPVTAIPPVVVVPPVVAPPVPVFSGPITITRGGTYSGNWETTDPAVPAVLIQTSEPVIIENSRIRGVGHYGLIEGFGNDLTVRGSTFTGVLPAARGASVPRAVSLAEVHNVRLEHNTFDHTAGAYLYLYRGDGTPANTVTVRYNLALNADGRQSDGAGGFIDGKVSHSLTNFVQFNQLQNLPWADISWNQSTDEPGKSLSEDKVNMYVSSGTDASPILIHDNLIQGAYNADPANDPAFAGGGIILGDGPVTAAGQSAHIWAYGNTVLDTTNYGMAIAGGSDMRIYNNRVLSSGLLPDGRHVAAQNVGLYLWNYGGAPQSLMQGNRIENNVVSWAKWGADGVARSNSWWFPDCTAAATSTCGGNSEVAVPTLASQAGEVQSWKARAAAAGYTIGAPR